MRKHQCKRNQWAPPPGTHKTAPREEGEYSRANFDSLDLPQTLGEWSWLIGRFFFLFLVRSKPNSSIFPYLYNSLVQFVESGHRLDSSARNLSQTQNKNGEAAKPYSPVYQPKMPSATKRPENKLCSLLLPSAGSVR